MNNGPGKQAWIPTAVYPAGKSWDVTPLKNVRLKNIPICPAGKLPPNWMTTADISMSAGTVSYMF